MQMRPTFERGRNMQSIEIQNRICDYDDDDYYKLKFDESNIT